MILTWSTATSGLMAALSTALFRVETVVVAQEAGDPVVMKVTAGLTVVVETKGAVMVSVVLELVAKFAICLTTFPTKVSKSSDWAGLAVMLTWPASTEFTGAVMLEASTSSKILVG